jgi:integrase
VDKGNRTLEQRADGTETIVGLPQLDKFFGFSADSQGCPVTRITTAAADEFKKVRRAEGAGPAMINRSLSCLRRMLRIAHEDETISRVPKIRLITEPPARKGFVLEEQFNELLELLPTHLRPLILFLYWCGVRKGEALQIQWSQVDLNTRLIWLEPEQTKSKDGRVVPLPGVLVAILQEMNPKVGPVFSDTNLRTEWGKACAACGLGVREKVEGPAYTWHKYSGLIVHDLRRSAVRNLRLAGVSESEIMKITGHKTATVFRRYNIVSPDDVSAAMRKLETASLENVTSVSVKLGKISDRGKSDSTQLVVSKSMGA